ncbi:SDR family NAD(P)-dependent oxidoreductase [Megalodesulfovibrio paquesii]
MKTVFITGATAGFGAACVRLFAKNNWNVVASGRNEALLKGLVEELAPAPVHPLVLDVRDKDAVFNAVADLPKAFAAVDVLVNNAGLALGLEPAFGTSLDDWEVMVDTNIKGLLYCTRAILPGMVERGTGHVVNLGSIAGSHAYRGANVYGASKAFVQQFSANLRSDLLGTNVRVTNIEPGMAETNFSKTRFHGDETRAATVYKGVTPLYAEDIAEAIFWAATRPAHVNIARVEIWPTNQADGGPTVHRSQD